VNSCLRGKYRKKNALLIYKNLESFVLKLFYDLNNQKYKHFGYNFFVNYDSKKRVIASACLKDKIVHRTLYNEMNFLIDKRYIYDSYACRNWKGTIAAIRRCQKFLRNRKLKYFLKMDVKKYFDSVNHLKLKRILIESNYLLPTILMTIDSYCTQKSKGIPIGNLTSQMFANIYLDKLDVFAKHKLKIKYYVRYMDDFIIFDYDKKTLKKLIEVFKDFVKKELDMEFENKNIILSQTKNGAVFLGKRIFWNKVYILRKTKKRIRKKIGKLNYQYKKLKTIDIHKYSESMYSYFGYIRNFNY
jgi:hypothetical protein